MPKSRKRKKKTKSLLEGGRRLPTPEEVLREQFHLFREEFRRDPGPNDPVFFDPDSNVPEQWPTKKLDAAMEKSTRASGMPPQIVYAYKKTGLLLMEDSPASKADRKEWLDAIEEYVELERKAGRDS